MQISQTPTRHLSSIQALRLATALGVGVSLLLALTGNGLCQTNKAIELARPNSTIDEDEATAAQNGSSGQRPQPALDPSRVKSINDRIQLLSSLLAPDSAGEKNKSTRDPDNAGSKTRPQSSSMNERAPAEKSSSSQTNDPLPENSSAANQSMKPKITLVGAKISEPVNTLELGYSLFMTRNYEAAEKNFAQLLKLKPEPGEVAWLHCMIGCCRSLQNRFIASDVSLRKCVNHPGASPFAAKYSEWKLRYLDGRNKANQAFKDIETELNSITAEN